MPFEVSIFILCNKYKALILWSVSILGWFQNIKVQGKVCLSYFAQHKSCFVEQASDLAQLKTQKHLISQQINMSFTTDGRPSNISEMTKNILSHNPWFHIAVSIKCFTEISWNFDRDVILKEMYNFLNG